MLNLSLPCFHQKTKKGTQLFKISSHFFFFFFRDLVVELMKITCRRENLQTQKEKNQQILFLFVFQTLLWL